MGRIDDALSTIESIEDGTERAFQLAGLVSTLFKIRGVALVVTGQLAFNIYANVASTSPEVDLALFAGQLPPRTLLDVLRGQLYGKCHTLSSWTVAGIPLRMHPAMTLAHRDLCRDFTTDMGVIKLVSAEELAADLILASAYPMSDPDKQTEARLLLANALSDAFEMNWTILRDLCHRPEYRVGEELAQLRTEAKREADARAAAVEEPPPAESTLVHLGDDPSAAEEPPHEEEASAEPVAEVEPAEAAPVETSAEEPAVASEADKLAS